MSNLIYVATDNGTEGPFTSSQLDHMVRAGKINADAPSLREGEEQWRTLNINLRQNKTSDQLPAGQVVGIFLLLGALGCLIYALCIDVSVPVAGVGRVNNLGLMSDRQTFLIIGGIGSIISTMLIIFCRRS